MEIEQALGKFLIQLRADGRSGHTVKQYERHVRLFAHWARQDAHCGAEIERLGHEHVAAFLASAVANISATGGQKLATSQNCLRSSLKGFFAYLHKAGYIASDPGRMIRRARCSPPPPKGLSSEEERRLLAALRTASSPDEKRDATLFMLMLRTGIRIGSALALRAEDVDLEREELRLRTTKGDRRDVVILSREVVKLLGEYLKGHTSGPLFTGRDGEAITGRHAQRRFAGWLQRAGINRIGVSPHSLRHTRAMAIYQKTGDIGVVQAALGHKSIASTLVYARCDAARLRKALA